MITRDTALKVQAYVDGELPPGETRRMAEVLRQSPELRALSEELAGVKALLTKHEPEFPVPESREFHWSRISRGIERSMAAESAPARFRPGWWLRFAVPIGSTALLAALFLLRWQAGDLGSRSFATGHEIDTPLADVDSITFRSESTRMTVVWVETSLN
jgi:anti-sigma factor RsiW